MSSKWGSFNPFLSPYSHFPTAALLGSALVVSPAPTMDPRLCPSALAVPDPAVGICVGSCVPTHGRDKDGFCVKNAAVLVRETEMGKPEATNVLLMRFCCHIQSITLQGPDLRAASADGGCWARRHILERWGWGYRGESEHFSSSSRERGPESSGVPVPRRTHVCHQSVPWAHLGQAVHLPHGQGRTWGQKWASEMPISGITGQGHSSSHAANWWGALITVKVSVQTFRPRSPQPAG